MADESKRIFSSINSPSTDEMKISQPMMCAALASSGFTTSTIAIDSNHSTASLPLFSRQMITIGRSSCVPEQLDIVFTRQEQALCEYVEQPTVPYLQRLQPNKPKPKCFVSYAWGNPYYEYKVEQLVLHLEKAGLEMLFDRWEDRRSKELTDFVEKLTSADFVLVVGTEDYLRKYSRRVADSSDEREHVVRLEARLINHLVSWSATRSDKVITLLFESIAEKCFPPLLHPKLACDFVQQNYFQTLLKLIRDLHGVSNRDEGFRNLMEGFRRTQAALQTAISAIEIENYKNQQITFIQQQEAEEDRRIQTWLATKTAKSQSSVTFASSLSSAFQPMQRNLFSAGNSSENKQEIAAKKAASSSEINLTTASDKLTLKTGHVTAGRGIYRFVLTANPTLAANDMHAVAGDIKEIIIDSNTSVEKIQALAQIVSAFSSPTQTEAMGSSTTTSSSSSSSNSHRPITSSLKCDATVSIHSDSINQEARIKSRIIQRLNIPEVNISYVAISSDEKNVTFTFPTPRDCEIFERCLRNYPSFKLATQTVAPVSQTIALRYDYAFKSALGLSPYSSISLNDIKDSTNTTTTFFDTKHSHSQEGKQAANSSPLTRDKAEELQQTGLRLVEQGERGAVVEAIAFYQRALPVLIDIYGVTHERVRTLQTQLEEAQQLLATLQLSEEGFRLALSK